MNGAVVLRLPWGRAHLRLLVALNVLGAAGIALAWFWSAGHSDARTAPLNLAVVAMVVAGAANATWLMRGRRAIGARRRAWLLDLRGEAPAPGRHLREPVVPRTAGLPPEDVVLVVRANGAARFHRTGCALIADRPVDAVPRDDATAAGKLPCGACAA